MLTFSGSRLNAQQQQQTTANPETALSDALSAACRQDSPAFANSLTADNATAFRALPGVQRTAMMKRFVLLEEPGRVLLSTSSNGQKIVRCESPSYTTEMRLGETKLRENLAYVPMEIPVPGEDPRKITFGFVREGGNWKLLSVGLILLDVPAMAKQWEQADLDASEDAAIARHARCAWPRAAERSFTGGRRPARCGSGRRKQGRLHHSVYDFAGGRRPVRGRSK
jgi:hypothetical protein